MPTTKKHRTKTAAKKRTAKAAASRHHGAGRRHSGEIDIDLNSQCPDETLQVLLTLLRPMLQQVIKVYKECMEECAVEPCAPNYHNITVCTGGTH